MLKVKVVIFIVLALVILAACQNSTLNGDKKTKPLTEITVSFTPSLTQTHNPTLTLSITPSPVPTSTSTQTPTTTSTITSTPTPSQTSTPAFITGSNAANLQLGKVVPIRDEIAPDVNLVIRHR